MKKYNTLRILSKDEAIKFITKDRGALNDSYTQYLIKTAKQNTYVMFNDDYVIEFERPEIKSTMYYDDELDTPSKAIESWKKYNFTYCFENKDRGITRWIKQETSSKEKGCCAGNHTKMYLSCYHNDESHATLCTCLEPYGYNCYAHQQRNFVRYLTEEEQNEILEVFEILRSQYEKRLATYFKRYSNKITTCGYYANR